MPRFNGIQVCKLIKDIENIPFILYTAHGSEEVAEKAFETGVDDYLRKELKPSHYQVLAKRIIQAVEKYRLDEIRVTYKNRLEVLHKYTYEIASAKTLEEVAEKAFEAIKETLEFHFGGIHFVEGELLVEKFTMSPGAIEHMDLRMDGSSVIVRTANVGKTQVVPDTRKDPDYTPWKYYEDLLSEVAVPIILNGKVEGVVNVESKQLNAFSDEDVTLLETLVSHIASAYGRLAPEQKLSREASKRKSIEQKFSELYESSVRIFKARTRDEVCTIVLESLESILGFDYGSIGLVEGDDLRFVKTLGFVSKGNFTRPLDSKSVSTRTVRTGEIQIVHDTSKDPDYFVPEEDMETGNAMKSELAVPIREGAQVLGVINVESKQEFPFEDYEIKLIETLAMYAATALSRLEEKENIEEIIEEKTRKLLQEDRFASLGKVTSMVAHDIRNPLQIIKTSAFFLEKDKQGLVERILQAVDYADQILEDIKVNTVNTPLNRSGVDVSELIELSIQQVRKPKNIEIKAQVADEVGSVWLDPSKIRRMLVNLMKNAVEAMPDGGVVNLKAALSKGGIEFQVIDNGEGMPEEVKKVLFSEIITTKATGTGLGLPFCKRAAEIHGGSIDVESSKKSGTTVKVFIPLWTDGDSQGVSPELIY